MPLDARQRSGRTEDLRFVTGAGRYVDDITLSDQAHAVILYSPHAHAVLRNVNVAAARSAPGVLCVLTGVDAVADGLGALLPPFMPQDVGGPSAPVVPQPVLAQDRVRYVGDRVALVVAETLHQANDALELIEVEYEPLPFVTETQRALAEDAPVIWPACPRNVCFQWRMGDKAATDSVFRDAAHTVIVDLKNNRVTPMPIEPRAAIGIFNSFQHSYELYTSTQSPHTARRSLAQNVFHVEENSIRVIAPDVGGGFGLKGNIFPEDALVLWASKRCGRPVKWVATRSESIMGDRHARDSTVRASMALDGDGHILAIRSMMQTALGAYTQGALAAQAMFSLRLIPSAYRVPVVDISTVAVFTNTSPVASYRGPGRSEAIYLTERLLDKAAIECGIAADEIRRRNLVPAADMPYKTATGMIYDSGDFGAVMEHCLKAAGWDAYQDRLQSPFGAVVCVAVA